MTVKDAVTVTSMTGTATAAGTGRVARRGDLIGITKGSRLANLERRGDHTEIVVKTGIGMVVGTNEEINESVQDPGKGKAENEARVLTNADRACESKKSCYSNNDTLMSLQL